MTHPNTAKPRLRLVHDLARFYFVIFAARHFTPKLGRFCVLFFEIRRFRFLSQVPDRRDWRGRIKKKQPWAIRERGLCHG
jgi:hypothetical protein